MCECVGHVGREVLGPEALGESRAVEQRARLVVSVGDQQRLAVACEFSVQRLEDLEPGRVDVDHLVHVEHEHARRVLGRRERDQGLELGRRTEEERAVNP